MNVSKDMISIKQINEAVRNGDFAKANELADIYVDLNCAPMSLRMYLQSAVWRRRHDELTASSNQSIAYKGFHTNLHIIAGPFASQGDLLYGLKRLSFYIVPFVSKITILSDLVLPSELPKDKDIDHSVPLTYVQSRKHCVFQCSRKSLAKTISELPRDQPVVVLDFSDNRLLLHELKKCSSDFQIKGYGVSARSRNEGSLFIQCVFDYLCSTSVHSSQTRKNQACRLVNFAKRNRCNEVALVCNGPSIANLSESYPFPNKLKAVLCNTAFLNQDLKHYFDAIGLVFADPIFHFGISSYASDFREKVIAEAANNNSGYSFIVPEKYAHILFYYMPSIVDRSIVVPHEKIDKLNHDLTSPFLTKTTANILTFLMIPIGSTIAKTIYLFGVDGRPRSEDKYFWSHDKKSQLSNDKMDNIRSVHPSFFSIDYNDYYDEHVSICDDYCLTLESYGYSISCCTKTYIEPFQRRMLIFPHASSDASSRLFISINPDAGKNPGHYINHESRVNEKIISHGYKHVVLGNLKADFFPISNIDFIPTFSCTGSWMLRFDGAKVDFQNEFQSSFSNLATNLSEDTEVIVYMYLGCTKVASWICELISNLPRHIAFRTRFYINCFNNIVNPKLDEMQSELLAIDTSPYRGNIHLSIDTAAARQEVLNISHVSGTRTAFGVWPMISTTDYTGINSLKKINQRGSSKSINMVGPRLYAVYFPATSQRVKGIHTGLELCLRLSKDFPSRQFAIRRSSHQVDEEIASLYSEVEVRANIDIIYSADSDAEYLRPFQLSEVSCITYDPSFFASKTSAVLLDSVACGCKVVCCNNTWLSQELCSSELSSYMLSQDQSFESYLKAISIAFKLSYDNSEKIIKFLSRYNPDTLLSYLTSHTSLYGKWNQVAATKSS